MSHFTCLVLIPGTTPLRAVQDVVAERLARFDENTRVEPYRCYMDADEVERMATLCEVEPTDTPALIGHMQDWCGCEGGSDDTGLFYLSSYNPDSHWDWWRIGGRWNCEMQGDNVLPVARWDGSFQPFALVTDAGEWHQRARMGWWGMTSEEQEPERWKAEVGEILSGHRSHLAVLVDCHI